MTFSSSSSSFSLVCSPVIRVTAVDVIPAAPQCLLSSDYKPQTCAVDGCDLPVYKPGNNPPSARADLCISSCICLPWLYDLRPSPHCFLSRSWHWSLQHSAAGFNHGIQEWERKYRLLHQQLPQVHFGATGGRVVWNMSTSWFIYLFILRAINKRFPPALRCWNVYCRIQKVIPDGLCDTLLPPAGVHWKGHISADWRSLLEYYNYILMI